MIAGRGVAFDDRWRNLLPNKPMKLTVACGARSLSAIRWADESRNERT